MSIPDCKLCGTDKGWVSQLSNAQVMSREPLKKPFLYQLQQYSWNVVNRMTFLLFSFFSRLYLFVFRERGRKGEREEEKHPCTRETSISCLLYTPTGGPGLQPRRVPWPGIEPATFQFVRRRPTYWTTPVRTLCVFVCLFVYHFYFSGSLGVPGCRFSFLAFFSSQFQSASILSKVLEQKNNLLALLTNSWF